MYLFHLLFCDFASSATDTNQTEQRKKFTKNFSMLYFMRNREKSENGKDYFNTRKAIVVYWKRYLLNKLPCESTHRTKDEENEI